MYRKINDKWYDQATRQEVASTYLEYRKNPNKDTAVDLWYAQTSTGLELVPNKELKSHVRDS